MRMVGQRERNLMMCDGPNKTGVSRTSKAFYVEDGTNLVYVEMVP
jgi:hypothetical protein